jgi:vacuolar protein sorting-associated protein 35
MSVFDALRHLSVYLRDNHPVNHLADLYELVQYAGNIIPRLYLMITVGTVYMAIEDAPVKEIMKDMMEMSRGVQHPVRGLFLRYFLSGQARDNLPSGSGDGPEGNLQDSISFTLTNFVEMNKLWVRLQHQGHSREREQRTKERQELQLLVGNNLVRLSQLVDLENYKKVLPPLLEQVVQCRDVLAQEYLLEVITQVFPDEFHLYTLDLFLSATTRLNPHVNVKGIVVGLMDRLSAYAQRQTESEPVEERMKKEEESVAKLLENLQLGIHNKKEEEPPKTQNGETSETPAADSEAAPSESDNKDKEEESKEEDEGIKKRGIPDNVKLFEIFYEQVINLVKVQRLPIQDTIALLVSLSNLALNIYPERLDYVDRVLEYANEKVQQFANSADLHSQASQQHILQLLLAPLKSYFSLFTALSLPNFVPLINSQPYPTRRAVANEVVDSILRNETKVSTVANLDGVLEILKVLIKEGMAQVSRYPGGPVPRRSEETDETLREQGRLARIVHFIHSDNNDTMYKLLQTARKAFGEGNERVRYTSPALLTASWKLARRFKAREHYDDNWQTQSHSLYKFMHSITSALYMRVNGSADLALRLFATCGQVADQGGFEEESYEFYAQAFTVYEESISDSRAQFEAICILAGKLQVSRNFGKENYDTLITKCALHGSKLLKKPDQARAVYLCSHLWWHTEGKDASEGKPLHRDPKRVLECLQRALRVADACMDPAVSCELFVEILNRYIYMYDQENEAVSVPLLQRQDVFLDAHLTNIPRSPPNISTVLSSLSTPTLPRQNRRLRWRTLVVTSIGRSTISATRSTKVSSRIRPPPPEQLLT